MEATYRIDGMTCDGCATSVTKALRRLGLEEVRVSLEQRSATVKGAVDDAAVKKAIEAAGYDFVGRV